MIRIAKTEIAILAAVILFAAISVVAVSASAQKRRRSPIKRQPVTATTATDYSQFSHKTKKHQGACNSCHRIPTNNWKKVRDFPDIADYPAHDACVGCHRRQFFKGAKPAICTVCHTKVSPRDDDRFLFRKPLPQRQFVIEFPHDKHQDVIARVFQQPNQTPGFVRASFKPNTDDKHYHYCDICHSARSAMPTAPPGGWPVPLKLTAADFKAKPSSHAACFNCHWKGQQPTNDDCGGCHKLSDKPYEVVDIINRKTLKFPHTRDDHVTPSCASCHLNITKSAASRGAKPDVPIVACASAGCHQGSTRQDVSKELDARKANADFVCNYCHSSDVGRREPPTSHRLIVGTNP
jgi:hypothetical protein